MLSKQHAKHYSFQATCIVLVPHGKEFLCLKRSQKQCGAAAVYLHSWIR